MKKFFQTALIFHLLFLFTCSDSAYPGSESSITHKSRQESPKLPDYMQENSEKNFALPPLPRSRVPDSSGSEFELEGVIFEGNTVFDDNTLKQICSSYLNRKAGMAELEEIRYRLTRYYVDRGYVNSGALIKPGQKVANGTVIFLIVEGKLGDIKIEGNGRLEKEYISKRIWPEKDTPFNTDDLQNYFQMLLQDPLIERINGRIMPGLNPGEATLELDVTRARPYELSITADNHSSPNLGSERISLSQTVRNLNGYGDALNTTLNMTKGIKEIDMTYSAPVNSRNTTASFNYNYSDNDIVSDSLDPLGITSRLESVLLSLTHPLYRTVRRSFDIGAAIKSEESRTYIMHDTPFSFSDGAEDGKSKATILQLIQSFTDRTTDQVIALRSTFSFGVDFFDPTIHSEDIPDSRFTAWLGQIQYGKRIGEKAGQIILKGDLQLSDDRLLSMEQFSSGGAESVRGYRENENIGDNGYLVSLEWRIPVWESTKNGTGDKISTLSVAPFMDYGSAWNRDESQSDHILHSIGVGIIWASPKIDANLYYGYAIRDVGSEEDYNLQDDGIYFSVTCSMF